MNHRTRTGFALMAAEIIFGASLPIVAKLSYGSLEPVFVVALSTLIGSLFFAIVLTLRGTWSDLLVRKAWYDMLRMTLLIVVGFYGLFFWGLERTSAANATIIARIEILTSILILSVLSRHETVTKRQTWGGMCMLLGVALALFSGTTTPTIGDYAILFATFLTPLGNVSQQRARAMISGEAVFFVRSLVGGSILLCIAFAIDSVPSMHALKTSIPFLLFAGVFSFGLGKLLWIEALHRLPITVAIPLISVGSILTIFLASPILHEPVYVEQILALIPVFFGIWLLTRKVEKTLPDIID